MHERKSGVCHMSRYMVHLYLIPTKNAHGLSVTRTQLPGIIILLLLFVCFTLYAVVSVEEADQPVTAAICSSTQGQAALHEKLALLIERRTDIATMMPSPSFVGNFVLRNREFFRTFLVFVLRKMMYSYEGVEPPDWSDGCL